MPREVDRLFRYPRGRSLRLAKAGHLPYIRLPDGEIRFDEAEIERLLSKAVAAGAERREVALA
jgi:hypothetical protein